MKKMLISETQPDEVRIALVKEQKLYDLDIEPPGFEQKKSNIYKGKVFRIEPSLEAAFVDYGHDRHGFLPFKEVARSNFRTEVLREPVSKLGIKDVLKEGQELLVQIDKEERGNKGAALTTFISLAGSYLVLMPNNPRVGGVSHRIDGKERDDLRNSLQDLDLPDGMGLIVRTAGTGKSMVDLKWDLDLLLSRWDAIVSANKENSAPCLIYQEVDSVMRAVRDYLRQDIEEILVDNEDLFEKTKQYIEQVKTDFVDKVKLYKEKIPLFSHFQIEKQIETAYQRLVRLPSGGAISIDHTEALVSIDVNSSRATGGSDIEETARNTNLEAAEEIARQLRIRDIGGLIVIDFIDMSQVKNQREVGNKLREYLEQDRARVQIGNITRFGLLEMSRQRLRSHLGHSVQVPCPRCDGRGTIRSIESLAASIVHVIEEEAISREGVVEVQIQLPIELATLLLNERRNVISEISSRHGVDVIVLPNQYLLTPQYQIKLLRKNERFKNRDASYKITPLFGPRPIGEKESVRNVTREAAVVANTITKNKTLLTKISEFIGKLFATKKKKNFMYSNFVKKNANVSGSALSANKKTRRPKIRSSVNKRYRYEFEENKKRRVVGRGSIRAKQIGKTQKEEGKLEMQLSSAVNENALEQKKDVSQSTKVTNEIGYSQVNVEQSSNITNVDVIERK